MRVGKWEVRWVCPKCGKSINDFDSNFIRVCPKCGDAYGRYYTQYDFERKIMRWIDTSIWWKPWTWNNGYWESKDFI